MEQLITVCKRRKDSDSRSYMIDVGGEVRKALGMADRLTHELAAGIVRIDEGSPGSR